MKFFSRNYFSKLQGFIENANVGFCWEHILASIVLSLGISTIFYKLLNIPQAYSQLISGWITWRAQAKLQDYLLLLSLVAVFFIAYFIVYLLSCLIVQNNGNNPEKEFRSLLVLSTLPAWLWLSGLFLGTSFNLLMLLCSTASVSLVIIFSFIAAIKRLNFSSKQEFIDCVGTTVLVIFGTGLSSIGIAVAVNRLNLSWHFENNVGSTISWIIVITLVSFLILLFIWLYRNDITISLLKKIRIIVLLLEALMPLSFWILIPTPWQIYRKQFLGYPLRSTLLLLIISLMSIAYVDLFKRLKFNPSINQSSIKSALSPLCLTGLLLLIKLPPTPVSSINPDDYHVGEFLLPWWLWKDFGYIPFQDYVPARGLVNYIPGFLADIFFDGTASSQIAIQGINALLFLTIGFLVVSRSIGIMPAFLAFLLIPLANGISEIDILVTVGLCLLCEFFLKQQPAVWLVLWVTLGTGLVLFAPGQGGLLVLSTFPLGLVALWQAIRQERFRLFFYFGCGVLLAVILSLFTPIDQMVVGAVRYVREQSAINSTAYGIEWSASAGSQTPINYLLWEAIRASWIVMAIIAGLLMWKAILKSNFSERKRLLVFALPIALLMVLFIPRAAGRIDPGGPSRLGIASIWSLSLLLPILLLSAYDYLKKPLVLILSAFAGGLLAPSFGLPGVKAVVERPSAVSPVTGNFTDGTQIGLPNLGKAIVDSNQLKRLQSIQRVLSQVLAPGETYLDLTNRNAHYFYLGYPPPIEVGAVYNLVHDNQQLRALEQLKDKKPPVILVSADNILHDGGTAAFRSHLIYRYIIENYIPVKVDGFIYMVKPERLERFKALVADASLSPMAHPRRQASEESLSLLDSAFRMDNLDALPISWGRSFNTLKSQLRLVSQISQEMSPLLNSVESVGTNTYRVSGSDPSIAFNIESLKLNGRDAGILAFDFSCQQGTQQPSLEVYWGSKSAQMTEKTVVRFRAENGRLLIPLDAAPRWLLAEGINVIRFDIAEPAACPTFSLSNIIFFQRSLVSP